MNRVFKNLNKRVFSILLVTLLTGFLGLPIVNAGTNSNMNLITQVIIKLLLFQEVVFINLKLGELKVDTVGLITVERVAMQQEKYI